VDDAIQTINRATKFTYKEVAKKQCGKVLDRALG
jgi:hypothetical protein